ncbi:class I SAM-dependent methyltransferase [Novosphingobium sp. FSY-8]|uniref:Class I SAM-dependent methyltransferase n=1 Tax=Novosphingobium ovatum TaxID=1908523 RepID=A0ABW9X9W1_9SPHN|nr:RsmB/NOP family class I SAM-dependent RNA methyltransferase [Novosphingobium ovatum]NBC35326.1 class I SAM-dependent methyltransferase [Novosphingobium ovatum]
MTPQARIQAAIDILDAVIGAARAQGAPADRLISDWFRTRRFAGSKDRRAVRDLVYAAVRACGPVPVSGRAAMLRVAQAQPELAVLFDGGRHAPAPIDPAEPVADGGIAPAWLAQALADSGIAGAEAEALMERAPLDIRVNTLKADRASLTLPLEGEPLAAAQGLRYPANTPVEGWDAYADGRIEVQDGGSQLVCAMADARPGETVIDLCAGAGGKTLALAAAMGNRGTLVACDVDRARLQRLAPRATRAGAMVHDTVLMNPGREVEALAKYAAKADLVLIDAPCTGTGTWRRNPESRWRLTPAELARITAIQARLLDVAAGLVRPGGRLVFVTCSLLDAEGAGQFDAFLAREPRARADAITLPLGRARGAGWRLSPALDGTDGFFVGRAFL